MPVPLAEILEALREFAPLDLAETWDNVGLIVGDPAAPVGQVMTCLTLSSDVADEAVERGADLVVTHHPLLFRPVQSITTASAEGRSLLKLIRAGVAVYSPHTAFDSAREGINAQLAEALGLQDVQPLRPAAIETADRPIGSGRWGRLPQRLSLAEFLDHVKRALRIERLQYAAPAGIAIGTVAVACGSAAEFLSDAVQHGCDALITGEARFHACLEAREKGRALILAGHYATERPGVERLAEVLARQFPSLSVWASERERDPVQWSL